MTSPVDAFDELFDGVMDVSGDGGSSPRPRRGLAESMIAGRRRPGESPARAAAAPPSGDDKPKPTVRRRRPAAAAPDEPVAAAPEPEERPRPARAPRAPRTRRPAAAAQPEMPEEMLDDTLADPSLVASGAGVLLVAAVAVVLIAAAGFGIAVLIAVGGRVTEFAVLRALGVSAPQLLRSLLLEWGVLALCGGVLGFLLGRRIADVMLTALEVTSAGTRVVPPFTLQSDWRVVGAGLVVVGGCALAAVVFAWGGAVRRAGAAALRHTQ